MEDCIRKFSKIHIIIDAIVLSYIFLYMLNNLDDKQQTGLLLFLCLLIIDLAVLFAKLIHKRTGLIILRYTEILLTSAYFAFSQNENTVILVGLYLAMQMFELIFLFDYSDVYSRTITIGAGAFPLALFIIINQLFFSVTAGSSALEMISTIAVIMVFVTYVSGIFVDWVTAFEKRVFEQKRMTENAKEMNETLRLHQEKIKKANEELGIQKIKLENANRQVNRVNAETLAQNEILKYISSTIEMDTLATKITESVCKAMVTKFCALILFKDNETMDKMIYHASFSDISEDFMKAFNNEVMNGGFAEIIERGEVVIEKKLRRKCYDSLLLSDELSVVIVIPVMKDQKAVGAIFCGHEHQDFFDESINMFENIAAQILMALDNAKLYSEVQKLAVRDGLTGLYNRRYLNELVEQYSKEAEEKKLPLSAALFDIDHFKGFNDSYGHIFGDKVLKCLSDVANNFAVKNHGIASRYGGEEFVLVFLGIDLNQTNDIMIQLKETIDELKYDNKEVSVRISVGVTSYPEICSSPEEVLNRADLAMYYSKEHGRNRITVDSEEVHAFFQSRRDEYRK